MQEMYREMARWTPGGFVVERGGLVMVGAPHGTVVTNMAIVAGRTDVDTIVHETERVYGRSGLPFSVHTRSHVDEEPEAMLAVGGFHEIATTPGMILRAGAGEPVPPPAGLVVRPVDSESDRAAYAEVMAEAYAVGHRTRFAQVGARSDDAGVPRPRRRHRGRRGDALPLARHRGRRLGRHAAERVRTRLRRGAHLARRGGGRPARRPSLQPAGLADGRTRVSTDGLRDADPVPDVHPDGVSVRGS